jgi:hypothetical protein
VAAYDALGNASSFADTWWFALDAGDERSFGVYLPMVVCQGAEQRAPFAVREAYLGR